VDCPLPSVFNSISTNDFTIELWITPTIGAFQRVVFAQFDADNFASISLNPTGEVAFYLQQNSLNQSIQSMDVLNSLELAHIAVTWVAASQEAKIFINGNEVSYSSGVFVSSTGTDGAQVFTGDMDELSVWSMAKTECEISFQMNDKKSGTEPTLVAHYSFDQGIAEGSNPGVDEMHDDTSVGNDGALMGFTLSGISSNWVTSLVDIYRFWGDASPLLVGQLGLVSTINGANLLPVPGAVNSTFDPPTEDPNYTGVNDFYALVVTTDSCSETSDCFNVNGDPVPASIDEVDLASYVTIYPNPSNGIVSIESAVGIESIEVRKITGELVEAVSSNGPENTQLDLSGKSGVYLVVINTESGVLVKKILVQNT